MNEETKTDATPPDKSAYLKEAMRLVELGIEEQNKNNAMLEHKAVLLVMFCTAVISFLVTAEFYLPKVYGVYETIGKIIFLLKITGILFLAVAAARSMDIFRLVRSLARGSNPEALLDPYYDYSYDKFAEYYLNFSKEAFQKNIDVIGKKADKLEVAYHLLIIGLTVSFILILVYEIARFLS